MVKEVGKEGTSTTIERKNTALGAQVQQRLRRVEGGETRKGVLVG